MHRFYAAEETASAGARDGLLRILKDKEPSEDALREAIQEVNLELWNRQLEDDSLTGMGTTLTVLWPAGENMLIGHVGDSRAYLLRAGEMRQVTQDHSMVADMVRRGILSGEGQTGSGLLRQRDDRGLLLLREDLRRSSGQGRGAAGGTRIQS